MKAMSTLHLRNVPPELDAALTSEAKARGVSKNRRAIEALRRGMSLDQVERSELVSQSHPVASGKDVAP